MQDHVGDEFGGVISSVTNFGLFVRLDDLQIDGMIHVTNLGNEYFHYDGAKHCLIGEQTHTVYRLGDKVTVQVSSVSLDERRINLVLAGEAPQDRYARRRGRSEPAKPSVRAQLKAGKIPGKKGESNRFEAKSGDKDNEKRGKSSHAKGRKKPSGKQADAVKASKKKSKKKATKKAKRPGKNARKQSSRGANNT